MVSVINWLSKTVAIFCVMINRAGGSGAAKAIHLLSGVSGWGYPLGEKGSVSLLGTRIRFPVAGFCDLNRYLLKPIFVRVGQFDLLRQLGPAIVIA